MYSNDLTGSIPGSWKGLTSVSELNIRQNYLSDPFPAWIVSLPSLKTLDISHNQFTGTIPGLNESASLRKAYNDSTQNVDFGCNYFNGSQPTYLPRNVNFTKNCFTGYTDASDSCHRTIQCRTFYENFEGNCPPCPPKLILYNSSACLCKPSGNCPPCLGNSILYNSATCPCQPSGKGKLFPPSLQKDILVFF
jgi:hypothetical protein